MRRIAFLYLYYKNPVNGLFLHCLLLNGLPIVSRINDMDMGID